MAATPNDWQLNCTSIKQRGSQIMQSGQWSDCTFLVGTEPHQVTLPGHKLVLAMASPVFDAMFFGGMPETNDPIPILDVQPDAFKALLEYIYTDNINISSFDKACELCYGAKKYMLPHLVKECTKYMWSDLHPKNACRAYEFARLFEEGVLMDKCLQIISTNTKEVLNDCSFEEVELNTVITVFSLDNLNIDSELDLFDAAVRYAKAQERHNQERSMTPIVELPKSPAPSTSQENSTQTEIPLTQPQVVNIESSAENSPEAVLESKGTENPEAEVKPEEKPTIRSAVEKIRFLTLTPQQFANRPARSSLLTELEAFAVLMNILSSSSEVAMPRGFSTCRVPRKQLIGGSSHSNIATLTVDTPSPVMVEQVFGHPPQITANVAYPRPPRVEVIHGGRLQSSVFSNFNEMFDRGVDFNKIYCQRAILQHTECYNTSVLDCSVTFMVDKNICVLGVQIPTQTRSEDDDSVMVGVPPITCYSELLYAHLLDSDGARLTYTHFTNRVPYSHVLDIMFNRPVYIQRNKVYKVGLVFNKVGWYPMGTCSQHGTAEAVCFHFAIGQSSDSVRDALIRSIIFTY